MNERFKVERVVPYFMVENELIDNGNLSIYEISVYIALCRYADNTTNECYPSLKTISDKLSISKPTVLKYLDSLIEKGYVSKKQNVNEKSYNNNIYKIHGVVKEIDHPSKGALPPLVKEIDHPSKGALLYKDLSKKTNKKNTSYEDVFNHYISLNLKKHRALTDKMREAMSKAKKDLKCDNTFLITLLDRHKKRVNATAKDEWPVKVRGLQEFFGQKQFQSTLMIYATYDDGVWTEPEVKKDVTKDYASNQYVIPDMGNFNGGEENNGSNNENTTS